MQPFERARRRRQRRESIERESRIMSVIASLCFSVPTALLLWLGMNRELAWLGRFAGVPFLWGLIGVSTLVALVAPSVFPSLMGYVWRGMLRLSTWLGW